MPAKEKNPHAVALGRKGGKANAEKHGREHFEAIGRKGGHASGPGQGVRVIEAFRKARLYDELDVLGLLPSASQIASAQRRLLRESREGMESA